MFVKEQKLFCKGMENWIFMQILTLSRVWLRRRFEKLNWFSFELHCSPRWRINAISVCGRFSIQLFTIIIIFPSRKIYLLGIIYSISGVTRAAANFSSELRGKLAKLIITEIKRLKRISHLPRKKFLFASLKFSAFVVDIMCDPVSSTSDMPRFVFVATAHVERVKSARERRKLL